MAHAPVIVWFRQDLRLRDNPALAYALASGAAIVPVFIRAPEDEGEWAPGAASRWWLHQSLAGFDACLRGHGSRLLLRRGPALGALRKLVQETSATSVVWNRRYEPASIARDTAVKQALLDDGIDARSFNGALLHAPNAVANQSGRPFQVFTPFWKHVSTLRVRDEVAAPTGTMPTPGRWPASDMLESYQLKPAIPWDHGFFEHWQPGEVGAVAALTRFVREAVEGYARERDRPDLRGTSRLSPHLHFGEIGPVQIFHAVQRASQGHGAEVFLKEVGWREFAHHLLFHFPHTTTEPLRPEFGRFPWADDAARLRAWQRGRTGYPIVDAGMRELWTTGWMHNRVRMIVASFLVKHLRLPWLEGARWFWDTLVDADLASNTLGWQWSAGCGADAAPYFRVFNPILQGVKFDPHGDYVRLHVPELARVPAAHIHAPWEAPAVVLAAAGVRLGETYPKPCVDHKAARDAALAAFAELKKGA